MFWHAHTHTHMHGQTGTHMQKDGLFPFLTPMLHPTASAPSLSSTQHPATCPACLTCSQFCEEEEGHQELDCCCGQEVGEAGPAALTAESRRGRGLQTLHMHVMCEDGGLSVRVVEWEPAKKNSKKNRFSCLMLAYCRCHSSLPAPRHHQREHNTITPHTHNPAPPSPHIPACQAASFPSPTPHPAVSPRVRAPGHPPPAPSPLVAPRMACWWW